MVNVSAVPLTVAAMVSLDEPMVIDEARGDVPVAVAPESALVTEKECVPTWSEEPASEVTPAPAALEERRKFPEAT